MKGVVHASISMCTRHNAGKAFGIRNSRIINLYRSIKFGNELYRALKMRYNYFVYIRDDGKRPSFTPQSEPGTGESPDGKARGESSRSGGLKCVACETAKGCLRHK